MSCGRQPDRAPAARPRAGCSPQCRPARWRPRTGRGRGRPLPATPGRCLPRRVARWNAGRAPPARAVDGEQHGSAYGVPAGLRRRAAAGGAVPLGSSSLRATPGPRSGRCRGLRRRRAHRRRAHRRRDHRRQDRRGSGSSSGPSCPRGAVQDVRRAPGPRQPGRVEGVAPPPVRQRQPGGHPHVLGRDDRRAAVPGGEAMAVRAITMSARIPSTVERRADLGDLPQRRVGEPHLGQPLARGRDPLRPALARRPAPLGGEAGRVGLVGQPAAHHLDPLVRGPGWRATSTVSPNRSSSCGRSSPSSGFIVPTSTNRAACVTETPSRSTWARPIAAASSSRSTRWSGSRFTSST